VITEQFIPDAEASDKCYIAVLRDRQWRIVANCLHQHRTREAAEKCAEEIHVDPE
jgi:hypothetical protein